MAAVAASVCGRGRGLRRHHSRSRLFAAGVALLLCISITTRWTDAVALGVAKDYVPSEELRYQVAVAASCMLIGGFAFVLAIFYLVNNEDPEIQMYSWQVISSTVNIFCAVLTFAGVNRLIHYCMEIDHTNLQTPLAIAVDFAQMLAWVGAMRLVLWYVARRARIESERGESKERHVEHHLDIKCWGMLFAHIAGFAAINCFGDLQQNQFFSQSPVHAFMIVPLTAICLSVLFWCLDAIGHGLRRRRLLALGRRFFELMEEEAEEAENDMMALSISFLVCQSLRFYTGGNLPDTEGEEPPHTSTVLMLVCSLLFAAVAVMFILLMDLRHVALTAVPTMARASDVIQLICCMCCAWCSYYGMKRLFLSFGNSSGGGGDPAIEEVLRIGLAVANSMVAFILIFVLNALVDREKMFLAKTAQKIKDATAIVEKDDGIDNLHRTVSSRKHGRELQHRLVMQAAQTLIKAQAILVGFSWEQAFDSSVGKTCERITVVAPAWAELAFAAVMVGMVLPAWRLYILPHAQEHPRLEDGDGSKAGSIVFSRQATPTSQA